jgi:large subunit ribosomal protein L21
MYAIIKTGGKQYSVTPGDRLFVERLELGVGDKVEFDKVLYVSADDFVQVGTPYLDAVRVLATVLETGKAKKVVIFKYKAKKDYRKKQGHRQPYTLVEIDAVTADGKTIGKKPKETAVKEKAKEQAAPAEDIKTEAATDKAEATATDKVADVEAKPKAKAKKAATGEKPAAAKQTAKPKAEKKAAEGDTADTAAEKPAAKRTAKPKTEKKAADGDAAGTAAEKPAAKRTAKPKTEKKAADGDAADKATEKPAPKRTAKPKAESADTAPAAPEEEK